jgi:hypothetical protein
LARAYFEEAFALGGLAGDSNLQAWSRGLQSFCAYYAEDYSTALDLAVDGLRYARSGPQSVRLSVNGAARAMGKLNDAEGVHRLVGEAYEFLSSNDVPNGLPSSIGLGCYSEAQVAGNAATAYLSLGEPAKVRHYVGLAAPDNANGGSPWSRALVAIDLATAIAQSKDADLDHASKLILDAIGATKDRPIIAVRQRATEFATYAVQRWGQMPQVTAIHDALSSMEHVG